MGDSLEKGKREKKSEEGFWSRRPREAFGESWRQIELETDRASDGGRERELEAERELRREKVRNRKSMEEGILEEER